MAGPPASLDVNLLTLLLERAYPFENTRWRMDWPPPYRDLTDRRCMRRLAKLRLVCKHWYEAVGHCQLRLKICKEDLRRFPEIRHDRIGSLLAKFAPGATAIEIDDRHRDRTQKIDIDSLVALQHLSTLRIEFWYGARFSVERFTRLQELVVTRCRELDITWLPAALPNLTQLTSFTWGYNCLMPDEGFAGLGRLTRLKELSVICTSLNASVSTFSSLQQLERLDLQSSYQLDGGNLAALSVLQNLRYLDLKHCHRLKDLVILHNTALTCLKLAACGGLTDSAMVHVAHLTNLESLDLTATNFNDWGLKQLSSMTRLTDLKVNDMSMATPDGLQQVPCLRNRDVYWMWYS